MNRNQSRSGRGGEDKCRHCLYREFNPSRPAERRISDISEGLGEKLIDLFITLRFASQIDDVTGVVKDTHLKAYVWCKMETYIKEDILFCKPISVEENEIDRENCTGPFTEEHGQ
jgi:hypothetical protein